ncbi:MAG: ribonuclease III domain-containing protein [Candidatus Gastranaerophilales bacterium]|nr:ribonuclease III domain-containing protein [Candidatus Gastranaerophilales bacterium]
MNELNIRNYAHLGDAVYEVYIREKVILHTSNSKRLHDFSVKFVNAEFQTHLLEKISDNLTPEEHELVRRGRNIPTSSARRINKALHSQATALEVLLGYNYLHNKPRYQELCKIMDNEIIFE